MCSWNIFNELTSISLFLLFSLSFTRSFSLHILLELNCSRGNFSAYLDSIPTIVLFISTKAVGSACTSLRKSFAERVWPCSWVESATWMHYVLKVEDIGYDKVSNVFRIHFVWKFKLFLFLYHFILNIRWPFYSYWVNIRICLWNTIVIWCGRWKGYNFITYETFWWHGLRWLGSVWWPFISNIDKL